MRRYDPTPRRDRLYRRRPGVYAVLLRAGQILLTHQSRPRAEFQLPGGGIDPGEHVLPALHREVIEETGWTIAAPRALGRFRRFTYMPEYDLWADKICTIYLARPVLQRALPSEPGHTAHWMPAAQALDLLANAGERDILAALLPRRG